MSDPIRWRDAPDMAPLGVADLLARAKKTHAIHAAAHARTGLAVAKVAAVPVATAMSMIGAKGIVAAIALCAVPVVAVAQSHLSATSPSAGAAFEVAAPRARAERTAHRATATPIPKSVAAPVPVDPPAAPATTTSALAAPTHGEPEPIALPPPPEPPPQPVATARADILAREVSLVDSARAALATDPARALREADAHRHEYPNGELASERELVAVKALLRLRRFGEARARGEAILASDPASLYADRVRALLADAR